MNEEIGKMGNTMSSTKRSKTSVVLLVSFVVPALLYSLLLWKCNIYPFGTISNMTRDLHIQYVDLLSYLWDVLHGLAKINYTFSKSLGGSGIGMYAYYLASPINILLFFFEKQDIPLFIYFALAIKLGLCGMFQALFLNYRFPEMKQRYAFLLSVCYAFSFYNIWQMDNIMWMDGVYMLPLVMVGVDKSLREEKHAWLIIATGCTILFNWYTAYMVCLFAGIYFLYEMFLAIKEWKKMINRFVLFVRDMLLGVFISAVSFLPAVYSLTEGKGHAEQGIFKFGFNGSIAHLIRGFVAGNDVGDNNLSLFCGTIIVVFVMTYFLSIIRRRKWKEFILSGILLLVMMLSFVFDPLENIWNGFRLAESYFCRFSFLQTWMLIFFAAQGVLICKLENKMVVCCCGCIMAAFLCLNYRTPFVFTEGYRISIAALLVIACSVGMGMRFDKENMHKLLSSCVIVTTVIELFAGGVSVVKSLYWDEAERYTKYVSEQNRMLLNINDDELFYRMEQTYTREENLSKCTPYFNENLAYGYKGFSQYTSTFNERLRKLGEQLGYGINGTMTMYDEPILTSDSLLGIKYIFSNQEFPGYRKLSDKEWNNKSVYENPYALPLGFKVSDMCSEYVNIDGENFDFQNTMYAHILGERMKIFEPVEYEVVEKEGSVDYVLQTKQGDDLIYAYADVDVGDVQIFIDETYRCNYQRWLSYRVFNVGKASEQHIVSFRHADLNHEAQIHPVFRRLNMKKFKQAIEKLKRETLEVTRMEDGLVEGIIDVQDSGSILLTIPDERGWKATVNGEPVEIKTGCNALMMLPVQQGENTILLKYELPYAKLGGLISLIALSVLVYILLKERNKKCFQ